MEEINLKNLTPDVRKLNDIKSVIFDTEWLAKQTSNPDIYYMYRGVKRDGDLRYDITVIPPFFMGKEPIKTLGHFHGENSNEMYVVLEGEGLFLMQKGKDEVEDFFIVRGKKGDCVIVPKGYAHVTINPSETDTLKMANWVREVSGFDYETVNNKKGLCYYYTTEGWVKNANYKNIPELRLEEPIAYPENLDFLK
jgi:glucose-6-phosphate isomerase